MAAASTIPTLADVAQATCQYFSVSLDDLRGPSRAMKVTVARQTFCYLASGLCYETLEDIGRFVCRDHSTVHHGRGRIATLLGVDDEAKRDVDAVRDLARRLHSERRAMMPDNRILGEGDARPSPEAPLYARLYLFTPGVMQEVRYPFEVLEDRDQHAVGIAYADGENDGKCLSQWSVAAPVLIVRLLDNFGEPVP